MRSLLVLLLWAGCMAPPPAPRGAGSARPSWSAVDLERAVHAETNRVRTRAGLPALGWNPPLAPVARNHSADMARRRFFSHTNPDGRGPTARAARAGFTCRRPAGPNRWREGVGENLARYGTSRGYTETTTAQGTVRVTDWYTLDALAEAVVSGWMRSPGHRRNLLDAGYVTEALGVHISGADVFVTQAFC